jgi:flagellar biogenesis protein FliO
VESMTWPLVKMVLALGIVCAFLYGAVRLLKRSGLVPGSFSPEGGIRLLMTQPIGPRKSISLVEIAGEVLALGVCEAQITFLTKIENREFVERLRKSPSSSGSEPLSLFQYFQHSPLKQKGMKLELLRRWHGK